MLTRIYINNFKSFVNFECKFGPIELFMGANGAGKSTLFDVLARLQDFSGAGLPAEHVFVPYQATRWLSSQSQEYEMDARLGDVEYRYRLQIELPKSHPGKPRVVAETVSHDGNPVFAFVDGEVRLFNDSYQQKVAYPFDWHRSALATIVPRPENTKLMRFKDWLNSLTIVRLNPPLMAERSDRELAFPSQDLNNYASWFRHLAQEEPAELSKLQDDLRSALPGLESLSTKTFGGSMRLLQARFLSHGRPLDLGFGELSDGQRALIGIYSLSHFCLREGRLLCIDEPDNYVALREIQPWLYHVRDRVDQSEGQAFLISHSPELLDQLAVSAGLVFRRDEQGPVRVERFQMAGSELTPAELVARGWDGD